MRRLLRSVAFGAASGVLAGLASAVFLETLDEVTAARVEHGWLVWLLPLAGLAIGAVYDRWGGRATRGNGLLLDEIHEPTDWVPRRMAPLVFAGTLASHLFGASVGREGTALQMSGSLSDAVGRHLRLTTEERRMLLVAALAGGFGSVFGVPFAGVVFALEVQALGRLRLRAAVPAVVASFSGDLVVRALGVHHAARPQLHPDVDGALLAKVALVGVACGLVATAFTATTHAVRRLSMWALARVGSRAARPPWRTALGGAVTVLLVLLVGRDYLGLSLPLVDQALAGHDPGMDAFVLKLVFTAVAIGCGFPGGEVTPLFVIGGTLGAALAGVVDADVSLVAAVGFVAVFAGAANTPLACTVMAAELFGVDVAVVAAVGCGAAYLGSGHQGIYASRRQHRAKAVRLRRPHTER